MATAPVCRFCIRALRNHPGKRFASTSALHSPTPIPISSSFQHSHPSKLLRYASTSTPANNNAPLDHALADSTDLPLNDDPTGSPFAQTQLAMGSTETLFKECARQADYIVRQAFDKSVEIPKNAAKEDIGEGTGWWYENLGLTPTFNTWAQVTFLHMYLLTARIRYAPEPYASQWLQQLNDHFFMEAEHRMTIFHNLSSRMIRNKYLKELYNQWRGVTGAYDEGLIKGDAVLAAAVWRNVFKGQADVDWRNVALVVSFMRRGLRALDGAPDSTIAKGMIKFGSPMSEMAIVVKESPALNQAFRPEDEQDLATYLDQADKEAAARR